MKKSTEITKGRKAKKIIVNVVTILSTMTLLTVTASAAAGGVDGTQFINKAVSVLKTLIVLIGAGLGIWGVVNLLEGYGTENSGNRSQGIKQLVAGVALIIAGVALVPVLGNMMSTAV